MTSDFTAETEPADKQVTTPQVYTQTVEAKQPTVEPDTWRRSIRVRQQTQSYKPSMSGKAYTYAQHRELKTHEFDPRVVEFILTQLSLKVGLNAWGDRAVVAAEAEMKQLHWRNSFRPVLFHELTEKQKQTILESHIFLKIKELERSRDGQWPEETSNVDISTKKSQVPQQSQRSLWYSHQWWMLLKKGRAP